MFDDTKLQEKTESNFSLICARPKYKTSDDYFVVLSKDIEIPSTSLFITSDKELSLRLKENGVKVCGPKHFMFYALSVLSGSKENPELYFETLMNNEKNEKKKNSKN